MMRVERFARSWVVAKGNLKMASITETAEQFFVACETGKGWQACQAYCQPDATFSVQAGALADVKTLEQYTEWMKGLFIPLPDGRYELKAFATDEGRQSVTAYAVFSGSHTGDGGPVPPTGQHVQTDYVYVMEFAGDKIRHLTKIWNDGYALKELGWA
jgi:predicted ester cyclase